jgi:hypothetical protein
LFAHGLDTREKSVLRFGSDRLEAELCAPEGAGLKSNFRWDVSLLPAANACCLENRLMQLNTVGWALM